MEEILNDTKYCLIVCTSHCFDSILEIFDCQGKRIMESGICEGFLECYLNVEREKGHEYTRFSGTRFRRA
jgi:hypothetical protein